MKNSEREHGRYGGKSKGKSFKNVHHSKWTQKHAQDYLNSDEGKEHAAMQAQAQNLMSQAPPEQQAQAPAPGAAGPASAAPVAAMSPQGAA